MDMERNQQQNMLIAHGLAIVFSIIFCYSQPQRLQFNHLTPDEGLSSSTVTCILQDHKGFMWFGTYNGLNRYDGISFMLYRNNSLDSTSLPHSLIWKIMEDHSGQLWIATGLGLSRYDWSKDLFVNYMNEKSSPLYGMNYGIQSITEDTLGNFWLGTTAGLVYFDRKNNRASTFKHDPQQQTSLSNDMVEDVFIDSKNRLWISTRNGLNLWVPESRTFKRFEYDKDVSGPSIRAHFLDIVEDRKGNLWIASLGRGLFRFIPENIDKGTMNNYSHNAKNPHSISGDRILSLYVDSYDRLWIGTENKGLNLWDEEKKIFWKYQKDVYNPSGLNNNSIYAIFEDQTGIYWIGTFAGGINVLKYNSDAILYYRNLPGAPESLTHNSVTFFKEDHLERIWIGTDGGGLNLFDAASGRFQSFHSGNSNLNSDAVLTIIEDSHDRLWIGTWAGGLNRFYPGTGRFQPFTTQNSNIQENNIFLVTEDKKGRLWLGSFQSGLIEFNPSTNQFVNYTTQNSGLSHDLVVDVEVSPEEYLYIGTYYGFNIFNPETGEFKTYIYDPGNKESLSNNAINDILVENDTTVWIATFDGLNRFNPKRNIFTRFYEKDGLPDNVIKACVFDNSGYLWLSTNKGLGRFDPRSKQCKIFNKADGLQSNEFNFRSALRTRDGRIFLGGRKGFNVLYPEKIVENKNVPRVLITDFYIFNKPVKIGSPASPLKNHISEIDQMTLSYRQSVFTFGFAVMDFTVPEKNRYSFRMEGFEKEWNEVGTQRTATYTNLGPGKYTFRVKGSNNDGIWNQAGASIQITITPPFWKSSWFQAIISVMIISLLFLGYKVRTTRIRNLNLELEQRIKERTAELESTNKELEAFSHSVSHDLRAPLRSMNGFSEILLENYGDKVDSDGRKYLQRIRLASERMGHLIDDLLKLSRLSRSEMEIKSVNLSVLAESIMSEIQHTDPKRKIEFKCTSDLSVNGDKSLLKVLLWNLLDNAWKFTSKVPVARIEFGILQRKNGIIYFIRDNGIGLEKEYAGKLFEAFQRQHLEFEGTGIGLATAKRIILRHGGSVWAEGNMNEGATFYFTIGWKIQSAEKGM
jgi:ligand-binding sensor domain-containing protein/signal transduction histidine kinase